MKDHLPPSAPIRTHYHFGTDIPIPDPVDRADEMAAYGEPDEFAGQISVRGWVLLVLAILVWAAVIGAVYVAMVMV